MPQTITAAIGTGRYPTTIAAAGHALTADEPASAGGTDAGPDPYALLLAALASCTLITLRMYADRKEWPLEGADVELSHDRIHAGDCEDCESAEGMITVITRRLTLTGALDEDQRQRLLEIANRCPVHKTLEHEIRIRSELAD
jgi:uncharacterized OsmC-like protein